jgi:hypothetical protein
MEIRINGQTADIRLENERTVGEIFAGLEQWLANTGHRLSGIAIDGKTVYSDGIAESFGRDIASVKTLDILTSSLPQLLAESLLNTLRDIDEYEVADFDEKRRMAEEWRQSPQAGLLAEQSPELYDRAHKTFAGEGVGPAALRSLVEERLRETQDPAGEFTRLEPLIAEICARLEDLPLDIQTGKDSRAAQTVSLFSNIGEKIFRLFKELKTEGFPVGAITVAEVPIADYITEFGAALRELLAAYEQHDTVLVGDLAEYEMAPRLRGLYAAISQALAAAAVSA